MSFAHPSVLWLGLGIVVLGWLALRHFQKARRNLLSRFASPHLLEELTQNVSWKRRHVKQWLWLVAVAFLFIALARPQYGYTWQESKRRGLDIMFAIDTSRSMLTPDINPDRLTRAKLAMLDMLEKLEGDRVGIIAFAGGSFLQCPLTIDYNAFSQTVEALDTNVIPRGGTDIAGAIREAIAAMGKDTAEQKTLIIITDGEQLEGDAINWARKAAQDGIKIFTVGVGTPSGAVIPVRNPDGSTGLIRDAASQPVRSKLNESLLEQIAQVTGGFYVPLGQQGQGLIEVYQKGISTGEKKDIAEKMTRIPIERYQWPLALAILILCIDFLLSERRRKLPRMTLLGSLRHTALCLFILLTAAITTLPANAASTQEAQKLYSEEKYEAAQKAYESVLQKKPGDPRLLFNLGSAAYKAGDYSAAQDAFSAAMKTDDLPLQQKILYNVGNTFYRQGEASLKSDQEKTIKLWEQALQSLEGSKTLDPKDENASFNYELIKKKLEDLKKEQEKQDQQKQDQDQKKDQQEDKDQKKDNQEKNQQDQNKKDQQSGEGDQDQQKQDKGQNDQQKNDQQKQDQKDQDGGKDQEKDQDQKNQGDQGKEGQDQKDKGKDPSPDKKEGDGQDGKDQSQKKDDKEKDTPGGKSDTDKGQDKEQDASQGESAPLPGQLNKQQAIQLLDSLKDEERKMPVFIDNQPTKDDQYKDW